MSEMVSGERNKQRKKEGAMVECLLEGNADDAYEMIPIDETKGHRRLDVIWKSLEERFHVPESVLEYLHKFHQFKRKDSQGINEYFVQLVAKANKAFLGTSAEEIGRHVVDAFALNVSDAKLTAKVIAHKDTLTLEQLGKTSPGEGTSKIFSKDHWSGYKNRSYRRVKNGAKRYGG